MFESSLYQEFSVKKKGKKNKNKNNDGSNVSDTLQTRLRNNLPIQYLKQSDIQVVLHSLKYIIQGEKFSYFKKLFFCSFACRRDRFVKLKEKAVGRFERPLDIRSFVSMYINLSLLLDLLFTK